jgi:hypothetical protein
MEPLIKGYVLQVSQRYVLDTPAIAAKVPEAILEEVKRSEATIKSGEWYPRQEIVLVWRALADACPDEASAAAELKKCGHTIAGTAVTTFFKLLLKMLSPRLFASKFPDFWARDHKGGTAALESVSDKGMVLLLNDVERFDHIGPVASGFIEFALSAIGVKQVVATPSPWSLAAPGPRNVRIEARWT